MDVPGHPADVITQNLDDLRRVNRLLGGVSLTLGGLQKLLARRRPGGVIRLLDVATGGADVPRAVCRWARKRSLDVWAVASDASVEILMAARMAGEPGERLVYVAADAKRLPFRDGAIHVALSSLALHHMLPEEVPPMLAEQRRCASVGVVLNDIRRNWLTYVGAIVATRLGSRSDVTWHDGPLSARRAFTKQEMRGFLTQAGLQPIYWRGFMGYRAVFAAVPEPA
jgi:ubiquinone/menaquinone biosynthesis C-methylase UbiE